MKRPRICELHDWAHRPATHAHYHTGRAHFYCDECISEWWLGEMHPKVCPHPCQELLEEDRNNQTEDTTMIMFYLDIESDAKDMQNLTAISKSLTRVVADMQKKIREGKDKRSCNGLVTDSVGNEVGEWDAQFSDG